MKERACNFILLSRRRAFLESTVYHLIKVDSVESLGAKSKYIAEIVSQCHKNHTGPNHSHLFHAEYTAV